ncbi:hypothetical protein TWF191_002012 [Orbilia oligospora]|uniref:Peptidase A1 domain-containing protein n=1 Tax=Orbilia oligospora TaxID=2813651 RepID=A0A7C8R097_ORBOL|nr:hypothetical protein TWF191_002012 [Orbilia oligospora]
MHRIAALITATLLAGQSTEALPLTPTGNPHPVPAYCSFTQTKFLPYYNSGNKKWNDAPTLSITVNGLPLIATMDTGSTGIVIDSKYGFNTTYLQKNCEIGHVFYSSSHWLQEGYWCTTDVDVGGVVTSALALIRTNEVCCPKFSESVDGNRCKIREKACVCKGTCTSTADQSALTSRILEEDEEISKIEARQTTTAAVGKAYMGVGFARGNPPSHNLFMNIKSIDGVSVTTSKFRTGYVINSTGVWLGITKANTAGFSAVKLNLSEGNADNRDWGEPPCDVQINDGSWATGTFLADTGIPNAYVRGDVAHKEGNDITIRIPEPSNPFGEVRFVSVPKAKAGTIGTENPMQPTWVGVRSIPGVNTKLTYEMINRGRKFYNGYDLYFDGDGGYFGLRKKSI